GAEAGELLVGQIRVPELAGITQTDGLTVLDDVGDDEDFRVIGEQELLEHVNLQRAETAAEGDLLFRGDALVTEHQQCMIEMGTMDAGKVFIAERPGQIQTDDLGTHRGVERANFERLRRRRGDGMSCCRHRKLHARGANRRITLTGRDSAMYSVRRADWSAGTHGANFIDIRKLI